MIGFVGAGRVGTSMGKYFKENGVEISGYYSRSDYNAKKSAEFTDSMLFHKIEDLIEASDIILITVPDDSIISVWSDLKKHKIQDKVICHTSGSLTSSVFFDAGDLGAHVFSLHPMLAVNSKFESWKDFYGAFFTVEGNDEKVYDIESIMKKTNNPLRTIDADFKTLYHVACIFVTNLVVGLAGASQDLFSKCGLDDEFSDNAWKNMFLGNAHNVVDSGVMNALTGPVERADSETINKHLKILERRNETIYRELSRMILDIAKGKNPERDYTNIDKELK